MCLTQVFVYFFVSSQPRDFVHTLGDAHIYSNHVEPLREQVGHRQMSNSAPVFNFLFKPLSLHSVLCGSICSSRGRSGRSLS